MYYRIELPIQAILFLGEEVYFQSDDPIAPSFLNEEGYGKGKLDAVGKNFFLIDMDDCMVSAFAIFTKK